MLVDGDALLGHLLARVHHHLVGTIVHLRQRDRQRRDNRRRLGFGERQLHARKLTVERGRLLACRAEDVGERATRAKEGAEYLHGVVVVAVLATLHAALTIGHALLQPFLAVLVIDRTPGRVGQDIIGL